jgi:hypothetical protein
VSGGRGGRRAHVERGAVVAPVGDEHLPADALARSFVQRVGHYADDLDVELRVRTRALADPPAKRALPLEEVLGKPAVDDGDLRVLLHVHRREVASLEERDLHRREIPGGQRVHERLHVFAILRVVAFHRHAAVPFIAAQNRHHRQSCGLHARRAPEAFQHIVVQVHGALVVVPTERRCELKRDEVVERHPGIGGLQVLQAPHEQAGAEEQQETERDLRGHEPLAQEQRSTRARNGGDRVLQRGPRIRPARP